MWWKLLIAFTVGFVACFLVVYLLIKKINKEKNRHISLNTFSKFIVAAVMTHGMILTTLSYVLAFIGMDPVVDVSSTIVREIVAPVLTYLATNTIMNIFEKNKLMFSVPISSTIVDTAGKKYTYLGATDSLLGETDDDSVG